MAIDGSKHPMLMNGRSLRAKLAGPAPVVGVFCELPCPEVVEIIGLAGWDFVILDCEHAPISDTSLAPLLRAASAAGLPAMVRVATNEASAIQHVLDAGPAGIQIPQVSSLQAAQSAIAASRFHPLGRRGLNPFVRAADFSACPTPRYLATANEQILCLQIESVEGIQDVSQIAELAGFDVLFVGPYDLSQSLGIPGEISDPRVLEAGRRIAQVAEAHGLVLGAYVNNQAEARTWLDVGVRYLCYSIDTLVLMNALLRTVRELRPLCERR